MKLDAPLVFFSLLSITPLCNCWKDALLSGYVWPAVLRACLTPAESESLSAKGEEGGREGTAGDLLRRDSESMALELE